MAFNQWPKGTHSCLITVDGHDLFLSTDWPDRVGGQPVAIFESGLGGSSASWPLVVRNLTPFMRVYIHDRAGLGRSEVDPSANVYGKKYAEDLDKLLVKAGVDQLSILVPMSWGGIVARESLQRRKDDVLGMVMTSIPSSRVWIPERSLPVKNILFSEIWEQIQFNCCKISIVHFQRNTSWPSDIRGQTFRHYFYHPFDRVP